METTSEWFWSRLACPIDRGPLHRERDVLTCADGHKFSVSEEIPILLAADSEPQYPPFKEPHPDVALEDEHIAVDPFVQENIVRTNGKLYRSLRGRLKRYPIPDLPLPDGKLQCFLDVGANWGRWSIAAARKGYRAVGIDVSLAAVRAGSRVARQLGVDVGFVVGDARHLPFLDGTFDVCFSFSVLQHMDKERAREAVAEMARVVHSGGKVFVQIPNRFGLLQTVSRARQYFGRNRSPFRVRHWTQWELRSLFDRAIGPSQRRAAGFFSLNAQAADLDMLPWREALLVRCSEALRRASGRFAGLTRVADSLYVESEKRQPRADRDAFSPK